MFIQFYQIPCVYLDREFPRSHHRLRMPFEALANFHRWIHMSDQKKNLGLSLGGGGGGGDLPYLASAKHTKFIIFIFMHT